MSKSFWSQEEVTVEILRKRAHKVLLNVLCETIAAIKDQDEFKIALDAALMYMTIDMGSTSRQEVKDAIVARVEELVNAK